MKSVLRSVLPVLTVSFVTVAGASLSAAPIAVAPNSLDQIVGERQSSGTALGYVASSDAPTAFATTTNTAGIGVGGGGNAQVAQNVVLGFLLPTLAPGESIASVTLLFRLNSRNGPSGTPSMNTDLYGLGAADPLFNPDTSGTTLFLEANTDAGQTKLADNLLTVANTGTLPNNFTADVTSFVTGLYSGTTSDGGRQEVFFRLNPDAGVSVGTINRYSLTLPASDVSLTFEVVPEPSALLLAGCGFAGLFLRRRRA